jgi:DNA-binding response OmpR family regulator
VKDEKRPLGKILLQRKLVSQQDLDQTLREQKKNAENAKPLASALTEKGLVDELDVLRALSEQHGVPGVDLGQVAIPLEHLDVVPQEVAETHKILPVLVREDRIFLAMADPTDKRVIDELEFVTGKKVYPYVALTTTLLKAIAASYEAKANGETYYLGPRVPPETLAQLGIQHPGEAPPLDGQPQRPLESVAPAAPAVVVDENIEKVGAEAQISTSDFGELAEEVSSVAQLPDDLRAKAATAAGAVKPGDGKLVLVVDDEEDIRKMVRRLLADKGFRVIEADRGLLALRLVKEHVPQLIILDAMLPELHGFDIARRIKKSEKYGTIPIIMVSAVYRGWRIAEDLKASYGIEEYLEKPFRIADMMAAIKRCMNLQDERATSVPPPPDPDALSAEAERALQDGIAAYKSGKVDRAIDFLKRGVEIDPLSYRLHFHLALLYGRKGQFFEGIQALERAVDLNPKHFPALKNLAVLYEKAGFKHRAVEMWERCIHAAPDAETRAQIKEHLVRLL